MSPRFIFATSNAGKAKEMAALLGGRAEILTLKDFPAIDRLGAAITLAAMGYHLRKVAESYCDHGPFASA